MFHRSIRSTASVSVTPTAAAAPPPAAPTVPWKTLAYVPTTATTAAAKLATQQPTDRCGTLHLFTKITFRTLRVAHNHISRDAFLKIWFPPSFQIPTQTHPFSKQLILQDILIYMYIYALCTFYVVFPPAALHGFYSAFVKRPCASQKALKNEMFYYCQITLVQNKHFISERTCSF